MLKKIDTSLLIVLVWGIFVFACVFSIVTLANRPKSHSIFRLDSEYTICLGAKDLTHADTIKTQMQKICLKHVNNYSVSERESFFSDNAGNVSSTISLIYYFENAPLESVQNIMDEAILNCNQNYILLKEIKSKNTFYRGNDGR